MSATGRGGVARAIEGLGQLEGEPLLQAAFRLGFISPEQRQVAHTRFSQAAQRGEPIAIGALLLQLGFVTSQQLRDLLRDLDAQRAAPGTAVGRYRLSRCLGAGADGEVWLAEDSSLRRLVALKLLPPSSHREALVAASLEHPSIVKVFDVGSSPAFDFIAMQFIEGRPLSEIRLDLPHALDVAHQIAEALEYAHSRGVIHRDVKPSNILLDAQGKAFLMDFGLAQQLGVPSASIAGSIIGTPAYMSPEQARGERVDARADVYGLGATLYFLIAGRAPFRAESLAEVLQKVQKREPQRLAAPRDVQVLVSHAMEKEAGRRYASMTEFREDLQRYLNAEPIRARPSSVAYRVRKWVAKRAWVASALLVAMIALGSLIALSRRSDPHPMPSEALPKERQVEQPRLAKEYFDQGLERFGALEALLGRWDQNAAEVQKTVKATIESFTRAIEVDPSYGQAALQIARVRFETASLHEAKRWCARAIELSPKLATATLFRALLTLQELDELRHVDEGQPRLETDTSRKLEAEIEQDLSHIQGDLPELDFARGLREFTRGRYPEAIGYLEDYLKRTPGEWTAQYWCGHAAIHAKQFDVAVRHGTRAIELRPRVTWGYIVRGIARWQKADLPGAVEDFSRALEINPRNPIALINRARSRNLLHDARGTQEDYTRLIEMQPRNAQYYMNRSVARFELEDYQGAFEDDTRAIELTPKDPTPLINRALALDRQRQYLQALEDLERALALDPKAIEAHNAKGFVKYHLGQYAAAVGDYTKALEIDSTFGRSYAGRGYAFEALSRQFPEHELKFLKAAEHDLKQALDLMGPSWSSAGPAQKKLGEVQSRLARFKENY